MKLEYRILWFEDDHESVADVVEALRGLLTQQGFELKCEWGECNESVMQRTVDCLRKYNPYDLMVFDYDLGSGLKGEVLAQALRSKIWTDILYYSANRNIKELLGGMADHNVEGVFCAVRQNLEDRMWAIVESQIKRICDLNNMRGIVLDAMSRVDANIRELFSKRCKGLEESGKGKILSRITKVLEDRREGLKKFAGSMTAENLHQSIFDHRYIDFQFVRNRLSRVDPCFSDASPMKTLQDLRNKLAHQPSRFNAEENVIELIDQQSGQVEKFDYDRFVEIRCQLLGIKNALSALSESEESDAEEDRRGRIAAREGF